MTPEQRKQLRFVTLDGQNLDYEQAIQLWHCLSHCYWGDSPNLSLPVTPQRNTSTDSRITGSLAKEVTEHVSVIKEAKRSDPDQ